MKSKASKTEVFRLSSGIWAFFLTNNPSLRLRLTAFQEMHKHWDNYV